ncbi:SusE domain-containing protein [Flavisolibacter nicotianae]|uniref:SusE domain-containing protein n=1 Tax=Flavisolibacter nicotianae TaxID=2364882 RepID=UPI000EB230FF|nr:SusE domain-containing protein [Flavisolibacter nicotianae]
MKYSIFNLSSLFVLLVAFTFGSCKKDERAINMNITEVSTLYAPTDNLHVKLEPATSASVVFEWDQAKAEDGSLVMYEVAFDKVNGDFTAPVYKMSSDGNGVQNKLTLSHKDLNRIANFAGIQSLETGKLRWTVLASKGTNVKKATVSRIIEVERPAGFAEIPTEVYLTGSGTEAGATLGSAIKMKSTGPGVFEIYTQLKPGTYGFVNKTTGTPTSYTIQGAFLKIGDAAATPVTTPTVYRIELDFNNAAVKLTEITKVGYWFAPRNALEAELTYAGNGVFKAENVPVQFKQESWGRDERYKFRMTLKAADGTTFQEDWGSVNRDNSRPTATTPAAWYNVFKQNVNQWDYTFKFPTEADMKNVDLILNFKPDAAYNHQVVIK